MDDLGRVISAYLRRHSMTQKELANKLGLHQSAVSRAIHGPHLREGRARKAISIYMQQEAIPGVAWAAILETWDGSSPHAEALAKLIGASAELWPKMKDQAKS